MSVVFAPELGAAAREAADQARLPLSEWMAQACQHKLDADRDAAILEDAAHKRRLESLGRYLDEYEAEPSSTPATWTTCEAVRGSR